MLNVLLALLCYSVIPLPEASGRECENSNYICSGRCPDYPAGLSLRKDEPVCLKNKNTGGCVCWLTQSHSSQLDAVFTCETRANGSASKIECVPPRHCFPPDTKSSCLVIPICDCIPFGGSVSVLYDSWYRIVAHVDTFKRHNTRELGDTAPVEKYPGDVREFSLKHLLFLLGFVIAPLLCWCFLNFLHEGKCRKKPFHNQPSESLPIPTSRSNTVDNMNNEDDCNTSAPSAPPFFRTVTVRSGCEPDDRIVVVNPESEMKCESPPPYEETPSRNFSTEDSGPPPSYDDAIQGTDMEIQPSWQPVFVVHSLRRESYVINCGPPREAV